MVTSQEFRTFNCKTAGYTATLPPFALYACCIGLRT